jgi:RNA polymerase sigma-70 factor (ECF subfamily)
MQELQDTDIIQLVLKGQQNAFSILVDRYQHFVFSITLKYVSNREEAEELSQDIFVKAYRSMADFKGNSKFSTWLYTIVHTTCLSFLRKKKEPIVPINETTHHYIAATRDALSHIENKSRNLWVSNLIAQLEETEAEVVTLFYLAEQSLEEIALITGQTPGNIKVRLFRARQKLKQLLTKQPAISYTDL